MVKNAQIRRLRLEQLDSRARRFRPLLKSAAARDGWIKQLRNALGISARQLAQKIGVSQVTLVNFEKNERTRSISIGTLDRIANALDCKVVYAFIPRVSFEHLVQERARAAAEKLIKRVSHSMDLEKQGVSEKKRKAQVKELAEEMARELSKELWESWK